MLKCVGFSNRGIPRRLLLHSNPVNRSRNMLRPSMYFFDVLEGAGIVEIGEERQTVGKDTVVESPAMIAHTYQ